jgi:hypothetical protein
MQTVTTRIKARLASSWGEEAFSWNSAGDSQLAHLAIFEVSLHPFVNRAPAVVHIRYLEEGVGLAAANDEVNLFR